MSVAFVNWWSGSLLSKFVHVIVHLLDASVSIDVIHLVALLHANLTHVALIELLLDLHSVQVGKFGLVKVWNADRFPLNLHFLHHHGVVLVVEGLVLYQIIEKANVWSCARTK